MEHKIIYLFVEIMRPCYPYELQNLRFDFGMWDTVLLMETKSSGPVRSVKR